MTDAEITLTHYNTGTFLLEPSFMKYIFQNNSFGIINIRMYGRAEVGSGDVHPLAHYFAEFNKFSDDFQHVVGHAGQSSFGRKSEKRRKKLEVSEKFLSLQRQNVFFDYAAECGEQGLIDTAPFKSHLRVAFLCSIFHISF